MGEPSSSSQASKRSLDHSTDSVCGDEKGNLLAQHWNDSMGDEEMPLRRSSRSFVVATPKILGTFLLIIWTIALLLLTVLPHINWAPHEVVRPWRDSDMVRARSSIKPEQVKFSTGLYFNESGDGSIYRTFDANEPIYVGPRTEEIDKAWEKLIQPLDLFIMKEEAVNVQGDLYWDPVLEGYWIEIEVFHSLHCLDMIRRTIYLHDYPEVDTPNLHDHIDHCIESLRQNIMCTGDMTAIPVEWSEAGQRRNPNFEVVHTCRNFEMLKQWTIPRGFRG